MSYSSQRHKNCRYNGSPFSLFTRQQIYFSCSASCENRTPDDSWKSIGNNATSFFFGFRAIIPSLFRSRFQDYLGRQVELHVPSQLYLIILPFFFFFFPLTNVPEKLRFSLLREKHFSREKDSAKWLIGIERRVSEEFIQKIKHLLGSNGVRAIRSREIRSDILG